MSHLNTTITRAILGTSILASILTSTSTARAQTKAEVKAALLDYFADDAQQAAARAKLKVWGNKSVPLLRELAGTKPRPGSSHGSGWALVCVLSDIKSDEALSVLVDILAGKTAISGEHALNQIWILVEDPGVRIKLEDNPEFKASVTQYASSKNYPSRNSYLRIVSNLGWTDAIETVRGLLKDDNLTVRKSASQALATLTGDSIAVLTPPAVFRKRRLDPEVLSEPEEVPYKNGWASRVGSFTKGFDGKPHLIWGRGKQFGAFEGDLKGHANLDLEQFGHDLLSLEVAGSPRQMIALVSDSKHGEAQYAISKNESGKTLWTYKPPSLGIGHAQVLSDQNGPYAAVLSVGGKSGLIAIDGQGKVTWHLSKRFGFDSLSTHPKLPGLLLLASGSLSLVLHQPGQAKAKTLKTKGIKLHARFGLLFPDKEQKPAILAAGTTSHSEPMIGRYDTMGKMKWRIILPSSVGGIGMIETSDWGRLFAAATTDGQLYVFDAEGTLRHLAKLPNGKGGAKTHIYGLSAGAIDGGKQAIVVHLLGRTFLYRLGEKE